ncbi:MAG TPA: hypothetical protein VGI16_13040 [Candidatus Acidoferrum sp.]
MLVCAALLGSGMGDARVCTASLRAQQVIDRIVARVETDVILLSDVRALSSYQMLEEGKSESDAQILDRLIDQWIVRNEAETARFPHPSDADVKRDVERLRKSFATPEEYEARKKQAGLSDAEVEKLVGARLYLGNYLDSKFRPAVQVDSKQVDDFYEQAVVPRAKARGQEPPSLDASREAIQEALVQRGIDEQANRWLDETRARIHVDKLLNEGAK